MRSVHLNFLPSIVRIFTEASTSVASIKPIPPGLFATRCFTAAPFARTWGDSITPWNTLVSHILFIFLADRPKTILANFSATGPSNPVKKNLLAVTPVGFIGLEHCFQIGIR